jgi:hypothetical protein
MSNPRLTGRHSSRARIGAVVAATLVLAACQSANDRLLGVTDPDIINPGDVTNSESATALAYGAINTFRSVTGADESTWLFGGLLVDEWSTSSTFIQNDETDQRRTQEFNSSVTGMLRTLYRTRTRATAAIVALQELNPSARALIAESYLARGFAELQLASDFCNGIPIGNTTALPPENGVPLSNAQVFQLAAASLDSAIMFANGTDAQSVLINRASRVARARAALGLADFANAATLVAGIPTSFAYQHTFSLTTGTNTLWGQGLSARRYSVGDSIEGNQRNIRVTNAIPFASANDPRLPVVIRTTGAINGQDGQTYARTTGMWQQLTAVDVANGVDARLIEAEVALRNGNTTQWLAILNALRAAPPKLGEIQPAALPALVDPGTADARVSLLFREKAFWTFSRGQRLGDLRRLVRQYGRTEANTFPQGVHYKGGNYGPDVNLPIVTDERNNPNFKGCTDRNA